ncbi:MAG TPA: hypothetical protein VFO98_06135 [Marmoricola sp.]|nr:hypothetical protein [Marmoricola sp.]
MRPLLRLLLSVATAIALVAGAFALRSTPDGVAGPDAGAGAGPAADYRKASTAVAAAAAAQRQADALGDAVTFLPGGGHVHDPGTAPHDDADPATKNAISRAAQVTDAASQDPTTPQEARANTAAARAQSDRPDPELTTVPVDPPQPAVPTDRYNLFNACYGLRSTVTGTWLAHESAPDVRADSRGAGLALYFKPTALGSYLLYTPAGRFLSGRSGAAATVSSPGPAANWVVTEAATGQFRLRLPGSGYLMTTAVRGATFAPSPNGRTQFTPYRRAGCAHFPEVEVNVTGRPAAGVTAFQETRGYIDAHTHGMAFEFLGGDVHCGRPWSPWGVTVALRDCPDHYLTAGYGAVLEAFLSGSPHHDPVGWPTFRDWPAPESLTHEGTYYKWMERSWRAGQRVLVNLLVENNQLCRLYPIKHNSCDDMDSIRLQAHDMRALERYIDAQHGGPGKGWYRIVTDPEQARRVINSGKMAVIMGIETSVLFDCHQRLGLPSCTRASIDRQLDEVQRLGVVQMELVNKFDNALAGVAGDSGSTGYLVNAANTLETGSPWRMRTCVPNDYPADNGVHDKDQDNSVQLGGDLPDQDALFGGILQVIPGLKLPAVPLYGPKHHCNAAGLTDLGAYTIRQMAARHMIFDPDHMSVKARKASLDLIDALGYSGVVSSHSWSTPDAYPRIYDEGGFITPYAGDSTGFVKKWKRLQTWANPHTYWGIGFGADINGLGAQGDPRPGAATDDPVTYPFTGLGGVQVHRQHSGQRVYDINEDGVAHYGLYPDWIEDLRHLAGDAIVDDLARGPEAYLQMWERAYGIAPNACTAPAEQLPRSSFTGLAKGLTTWQVLQRVGQPDRRLGTDYRYCSSQGDVTVTFTPKGRLSGVHAN